MDQKKRLRENLKKRRRELSLLQVSNASEKIRNQLIGSIDWQNISSLNTYIAVKEWNEIDTFGLLDYIWANWPHIDTSTMRVVGETMQMIGIDRTTEWVPHAWGMAEPRHGELLPEDHHFDMILVPVLAYDARGNRLGLGKGYYDRFLAMQPHAQKIGLAYSWARVEMLPYEPHDIKLDKVVIA